MKGPSSVGGARSDDGPSRVRTAVEVFGWTAAVLFVGAYGTISVLGPYTSKPENRNSEDLIVIPVLLALLSCVFAAITVAAATVLVVQRGTLREARTLVPATFGAVILALLSMLVFRLS